MVLSPFVIVKYGVPVIHSVARHPSPLTFDEFVSSTYPDDAAFANSADEIVFLWSFNTDRMHSAILTSPNGFAADVATRP
jgi:hypothetical protein